MKINTEMILALDLHLYALENYLNYYEDFDGSLEDFFKLENISFEDKIWVAIKLVDKNTRVKFAVKCAEFVLPIFEEKFTNDKRPRNCIELLNSIDDFENLNDDQFQLLRFHKEQSSACAFDSASVFDAASVFAFATVVAYFSANSSDSICAANYSASYASCASHRNDYVSHFDEIQQFLLDLTN